MKPSVYASLLGKARAKGLTQAQMAKVLGISEQALTLKLHRRTEFKESEIRALMELIDEPIDNVTLYFFSS